MKLSVQTENKQQYLDWRDVFRAFYLDALFPVISIPFLGFMPSQHAYLVLLILSIPYVTSLLLLFWRKQSLGEFLLGQRLENKKGNSPSITQLIGRFFSHPPFFFWGMVIIGLIIINITGGAFLDMISKDGYFRPILFLIFFLFYCVFNVIGSCYQPTLSQRLIGIKLVKYTERPKRVKRAIAIFIFLSLKVVFEALKIIYQF